jgi:hypothetical protein
MISTPIREASDLPCAAGVPTAEYHRSRFTSPPITTFFFLTHSRSQARTHTLPSLMHPNPNTDKGRHLNRPSCKLYLQGMWICLAEANKSSGLSQRADLPELYLRGKI